MRKPSPPALLAIEAESDHFHAPVTAMHLPEAQRYALGVNPAAPLAVLVPAAHGHLDRMLNVMKVFRYGPAEKGIPNTVTEEFLFSVYEMGFELQAILQRACELVMEQETKHG